MRYVRNLRSLYDFIATVLLSAPDRFRYRDYRAPEDQLNMDRAFQELREGLVFVPKIESDSSFHSQLCALLDQSLEAYRAGDRRRGAHLLQDFQDRIFSNAD